jgi:hypothetical protein
MQTHHQSVHYFLPPFSHCLLSHSKLHLLMSRRYVDRAGFSLKCQGRCGQCGGGLGNSEGEPSKPKISTHSLTCCKTALEVIADCRITDASPIRFPVPSIFVHGGRDVLLSVFLSLIRASSRPRRHKFPRNRKREITSNEAEELPSIKEPMIGAGSVNRLGRGGAVGRILQTR